MNKPLVLGIGAAAIVAYLLFRKASGLGTLNFYPASVKSIDFNSGELIMTANINVQNTSNQHFTLNSLAGNLYANGYLVGNAALFTPVAIQPNSQTLLPVKIKLSAIGLVNDIIRAFEQNSFSQELELEANANVDQLQIPVKLKYKVGK